MQDLRLMFHYLTETCKTVVQAAEDDVWGIAVPEEATKHEFLMDGLLAFSSLHVASASPTSCSEYVMIAIQYQDSALRKYNEALESITELNSHALFAYSIVLTLCAMAFPSVDPESTSSTHVEIVLAVFSLLRGIRLIKEATGTTLEKGKFGELFRQYPLGTDLGAPGREAKVALLKLRQRVIGTTRYERLERRATYLSGITALEQAFASIAKFKHLGPVIAWPLSVSVELLDLFKQGDPIAQVIFTHYGVLLLHAHDQWWGRDFGLRLVQTLSESISAVDPAWNSWTEWAREIAVLTT